MFCLDGLMVCGISVCLVSDDYFKLKPYGLTQADKLGQKKAVVMVARGYQRDQGVAVPGLGVYGG